MNFLIFSPPKCVVKLGFYASLYPSAIFPFLFPFLPNFLIIDIKTLCENLEYLNSMEAIHDNNEPVRSHAYTLKLNGKP